MQLLNKLQLAQGNYCPDAKIKCQHVVKADKYGESNTKLFHKILELERKIMQLRKELILAGE